MESPRKSVFISYAHKDNTENFVFELGYSLNMYMDAFWDVKLQAGAWSEQLINKIKECNAFLVVMSYSQKHESEWCQKELDMARNENKTIIPIKRFENHTDKELESIQYADFTRDFDEGFKELTYLITGERLTAWEYLENTDENALFENLALGLLPGLISKEFADYMIVQHLWQSFRSLVSLLRDKYFVWLDPKIPEDVLRALKDFASNENQSGKNQADKGVQIVEEYLETVHTISDSNHTLAGQCASNVLEAVKDYIDTNERDKEVFGRFGLLDASFRFDSASKLRELIRVHARRSRYLY